MPGKRKRNGGRKQRKGAGFTYHYSTDDSGVVQKLETAKRVVVEKVQRAWRTPKPVACLYCDSRFATTAARDDHVSINHPPGTPAQPGAQKQARSPYPDDRPWTECSLCGARLLRKNLKRHLRHVH